MQPGLLKRRLDEFLLTAVQAIQQYYGDRLVTIALYGSVARGTMRHDSDLDLLLIVKALPKGRIPRITEFGAVEARLAEQISGLRRDGIETGVSPVLRLLRRRISAARCSPGHGRGRQAAL